MEDDNSFTEEEWQALDSVRIEVHPQSDYEQFLFSHPGLSRPVIESDTGIRRDYGALIS
jgi:hypothetical protein